MVDSSPTGLASLAFWWWILSDLRYRAKRSTASIQLNWLQTGYRQDVAWGPAIRFVYWSAE